MGMVEPSLDELLENINSRYGLVITAAKRARLLMLQEAMSRTNADVGDDDTPLSSELAGDRKSGKRDKAKPVTSALREISAGKIKCKVNESGIK